MKRALPALLLLAAGAHALSGDAGGAASSTQTASAPAQAPDAAPEKDVVFYSDLGPDRLDVSGYPADQRRDYAVYARACSRCHSLARSLNAPYASRGWWEFYMTGMRVRGRVAGQPFTREEIKSVLDFLEYDSRVRKIEKGEAFEKSTAALKRRFSALVDQRMSALQKNSQTRLLPHEPPTH